MVTELKIRKFELTESQPKLKLTNEQTTELLLKKTLRIELLEVEDIIDPSDLIIVITTREISSTTTPIYLHRHRVNFIHQSGKFILDTKSLSEFLIPVGGVELDIRVLPDTGVDKFKVTMYYHVYAANETIK